MSKRSTMSKTPRQVTDRQGHRVPGQTADRHARGRTTPPRPYHAVAVFEACSTDCARQERDALSMTVRSRFNLEEPKLTTWTA